MDRRHFNATIRGAQPAKPRIPRLLVLLHQSGGHFGRRFAQFRRGESDIGSVDLLLEMRGRTSYLDIAGASRPSGGLDKLHGFTASATTCFTGHGHNSTDDSFTGTVAPQTAAPVRQASSVGDHSRRCSEPTAATTDKSSQARESPAGSRLQAVKIVGLAHSYDDAGGCVGFDGTTGIGFDGIGSTRSEARRTIHAWHHRGDRFLLVAQLA